MRIKVFRDDAGKMSKTTGWLIVVLYLVTVIVSYFAGFADGHYAGMKDMCVEGQSLYESEEGLIFCDYPYNNFFVTDDIDYEVNLEEGGLK